MVACGGLADIFFLTPVAAELRRRGVDVTILLAGKQLRKQRWPTGMVGVDRSRPRSDSGVRRGFDSRFAVAVGLLPVAAVNARRAAGCIAGYGRLCFQAGAGGAPL